jgi:hypothetical protein
MTYKKEMKHTLTLDKDFIQYCELNEINNIEKEAKRIFNLGFSMVKYPRSPSSIKECPEITNTKQVTTPRPKVKPEPQGKRKPDLYGE